MQAVGDSSGTSTGLRYVSVCDGIGAAHVAWQPLGWQCQWTSEIEPFPVAVVEDHYGFRNLGDMTKITEDMIDAPVELLVGGTPCQSFSVAGLRGGLADPRGNLALRFVQLAAVMQPKWIVWENVPGVLSSGKGRDFGTFLGALGELGYGFAYRILDAQWFGVAQRRRRVFVVGYLGDWRRAAAVLFERESVFGNPPTRGATGQGITSSPEGITGNVSSKWAKGTGGPAGDECYNLVAFAQNQREEVRELGDCATALNLQGTHQQTFLATPFTKSKRAQSVTDDESWVPGDVSPTMSCFDQGDTRATTVVTTPIDLRQASRGDKVTNNRSHGSGGPPGHGIGDGGDPAFTVSERGQAVVSIDLQNVTAGGDLAGTLDTTRPSRGGGQAVAFKPGQSEAAGGVFVTEEFSPTLQSASNGSTAVPAVAFAKNQLGEVRTNAQVMGTVNTNQNASGRTTPMVAVAFANRTRDGVKVPEVMQGGVVPALTNPGGGGRSDAVNIATPMAVRRLTPRECERLQGFPDDYTLVTYRGKPACDGPRYRALGNSMAVPVMRWIGERIRMVEGQ